MEKNSDRQKIGWGILLICTGLSTMVGLYTNLPDWVKISIFFLGGILSLLIYLADRSDWILIIPTYIMFAISFIDALTIFNLVNYYYMGPIILSIIAAPFLVVYFKNKDQWWALIPAFTLFAIALMILLIETNLLAEEFVATFILFAIATPFLYIYYRHRENWWALIPAYTMIIIGTMVALIELNILIELLVPSYILLAIAFPFIIVYLINRENWWALIPGGVLGFIGLAFLLSAPVGKIAIPVILIIAGTYLLMKKTT